jgi:hypothetical protein
MRKIVYLLMSALLLSLAGCKSSKQVATRAGAVVTAARAEYLSAKMQLVAPVQSGTVTLNGTMKMKSEERIQLSVLMPVLRTELFRIEVTPDYCIIVDRINKQYVSVSKDEMAEMLPKELSYDKLEALLQSSYSKDGKYELTGKQIGIPSLESAKVSLYEFSNDAFEMSPTSLSSRYTKVSAAELINRLNIAQ